MKTKQHLPVGVVWGKVAIVLDTGLTVKKPNTAFNDRQEIFNFFHKWFRYVVKTNYTIQTSYRFYYHCYICHHYYQYH